MKKQGRTLHVDEVKALAGGKPARPAFARGRFKRREPGSMTGVEKKYMAFLDEEKAAGRIIAYRYGSIKLRLADATWYTTDYQVQLNDTTFEFVEVKGSWNAPHQDDSRVKIKVAAEQYPEFRFVAVVPKRVRDGGGFEREEF
jgi:hypothetical protein